MPKRVGKYTIQFEKPPVVKGYASVAGKRESEGPLGKEFDRVFDDEYLGKDTFEQAESEMQKQVIELALSKAQIDINEIDFVFAGDLLNQCAGSTYAASGFGIPHIGIYGACSTMALGLGLAASFIDGGLAGQTVSSTSSHFCSSERQFRYPLEYGGQRPQTAQWTVTGAGAIALGTGEGQVKVKAATFGRIIDLGIKDVNNMGAAMAPAAAETILSFLEDTNTAPSDYDLILTGDLGVEGSRLLCELTAKENTDISKNHSDCGLNIFYLNDQDVHSGGSGCGCSASVLCSRILNKLQSCEFKNVLFCATGSLHSPTTVFQGMTIPSIAHLVHLSSE